MEDQIFRDFQKASQDQLKNLKPEDIQFFNERNIPENYCVILRFNNNTIGIIQNIMNIMRQTEPNQFYYSPENLHMTVIGMLQTNINIKQLLTVVENSIQHYQVRFRLLGLGSNKYCSSVQAYPIGFSMHSLRNTYREILKDSGENYKKHLALYEYMGWINICRYLQKPSQNFLNLLWSYKDTIFGEIQPKSIDIYKTTSKIIDPNYSTLIKSYYF